jgi:hypothetical protein
VLSHVKSDTKTTEELLADLRKNPDVLSATPNFFSYRSNTPSDALYGDLWGMKAIRADEAWDTTTGKESVHVAVIDTGIDPEHRDLIANLDMERGGYVPDVTNTIKDTNGHGTHVSGTIGAVGNNGIGVVGVNWTTKIIPLKVFYDGGGAPHSATVAALNYIKELQTGAFRVYAINLSLGGWQDVTPEEIKATAYYKAFEALDKTNKTIIAVAAGNENHEVGVSLPFDDVKNGISAGSYCYPASFTGIGNMIVVGAVGQDRRRANFSNYSSRYVDIAAPGVGIWSTIPQNGYDPLSGTSMATPHVTGAVGLLAAYKPTLTAAEMKTIILDNADKSDTGLSRYGLLDVKKMLDAALGTNPIPVSSIAVAPSSVNLPMGTTQRLTATAFPEDATDTDVAWSSDDTGVATVNASGWVEALSEGTAVITATAADGSGAAGRATVRVVAGAPQTAAPVANPGGGSYSEAQNVALSCSTEGAAIYYTLDGSTPTTSSPVYTSSSPVYVYSTVTLKAVAMKSGMTNSSVTTAQYTINSRTPQIDSHPQSQTVPAGGTAAFSVKATGSGSLSYQWHVYDHEREVWIEENLNPDYYSGIDTPTLTRYGATYRDDTDQFRCVVSNESGSVTSDVATLTVNVTIPKPEILSHPQPQAVPTGGTATFSVKAAGGGTLPYKWNVYDHLESRWITPNPEYYSGVDTSTLTLYNATTYDDTDQFRCVVSNEGGSVTSNAVTLTVGTNPNPNPNPNPNSGGGGGGGGCEVGFGFGAMVLGFAMLKSKKRP